VKPRLGLIEKPTVPKLGEREAWRPTFEVGGKLAVKNLHATSIELRKALRAGFKKRELMVWRAADSNCRIFLVAGFVAAHQLREPDLCGDLLDRYEFLQTKAKIDPKFDNEMLYVSILDTATRRYEVGFLDQPKRAVHSTPDFKPKHIGLLHESGLNRAARRKFGIS